MICEIVSLAEGTQILRIELTKEQFNFLEMIFNKLAEQDCPDGYCASIFIKEVKDEVKGVN